MEGVTYELPERVGGRLALDFVNTVDPRHASDRRDYLPTYEALLTWADDAVPELPVGLTTLRRMAAADPAAAADGACPGHRAARGALPVAHHRGGRANGSTPATSTSSTRRSVRPPTGSSSDAPRRAGCATPGSASRRWSSPLWPVALDAWTILTEGDLEPPARVPGRRRLRLAVLGLLAVGDTPLVRHAYVRQPRQGSQPLRQGPRVAARLNLR